MKVGASSPIMLISISQFVQLSCILVGDSSETQSPHGYEPACSTLIDTSRFRIVRDATAPKHYVPEARMKDHLIATRVAATVATSAKAWQLEAKDSSGLQNSHGLDPEPAHFPNHLETRSIMFFSKTIPVRILVALATIAALNITPAHAQTVPEPRGGPGGIPPLAALLLDAQVHASLALTTAQESQWSALQTAEQNVRTQTATVRAALQALIASELSKTTPDLVAIDTAVAAERATGAAAGDAIRNQAATLYETFNTGQQVIVIAAAQALYQRLLGGAPARIGLRYVEKETQSAETRPAPIFVRRQDANLAEPSGAISARDTARSSLSALLVQPQAKLDKVR